MPKNVAELFEHELRDVYDAEKQIVKALPRMIKAVNDEELRQTLSEHLEETKEHVQRLDRVFQTLDLKPRRKTCEGMKGLLTEASSTLKAADGDAVVDACAIAAARRIEHYEISAYGTLMARAKTLGFEDVVGLLEETEREEIMADENLSELESRTNNMAGRQGREVESEEVQQEIQNEEDTSRPSSSHGRRNRAA